MDKGSLAAAELMMFMGLVGWLLYTQYSSTRKDSSRSDDESSEESKKDESDG